MGNAFNKGGKNLEVYTVTIHTSERKDWYGTGTDDDVYLTIHGTLGDSKKLLLDKRLYDDLEAGSVDTYNLEGPSVGEFLYVIVEKTGKDNWRLNKIVITDNVSNNETTFPFYDWVENVVQIRPSKALLPSNETHKEMTKWRQSEISRRQECYQFNPSNSGLPGCMDTELHENLPKFVQFHDAKKFDFKNSVAEAKKKFGFSTLIEGFHTWEKPEDLANVAMRFTSGEDLKMQERCVKVWDDDIEYGNLVLNGPNPVMLERCYNLPDNFPVTNDMVKTFLQRNVSLEDEIKEGHVYILNYACLEGIGRFRKGKDVRYCANAMVLLYVRPSDHLVPIAIKLDQEDGPIWTPDDGLGWTMAKLYAKNADGQVQQMGTHLLCTHLVSESVSIAMLTNLSSVHPIYKLLLPHSKHTIAINTIARLKLIGQEGIADKTMSIAGGSHIDVIKKCYCDFFQWENLNIPKRLKQRGVDDRELLPNYLYRDDALVMWNAIMHYVSQMIALYYKVDADVVCDEELQNFIKEVHDKAFPFEQGGIDKKCPDSLTTVDELVTFLTMVIFNCSSQHAAINFSQFHYMSFPAAYPLALRQPPPDRKFDVQMADIMAALPDKNLTVAAVAITYALSRFADTEVYIGEFPEDLFANEEVTKVRDNFRLHLAEISKIMTSRNDKSEFKYTYMLPERTPSSIAA